jgi:hypothetical protein
MLLWQSEIGKLHHLIFPDIYIETFLKFGITATSWKLQA